LKWPLKAKSDPQQKSAVLEVIPGRRFLLSAHSISAIPPAAVITERNGRFLLHKDLAADKGIAGGYVAFQLIS